MFKKIGGQIESFTWIFFCVVCLTLYSNSQEARQVYVFPRKRGLKSGTKSVYNFVCLSKAKISGNIFWYFFEQIGWRKYFSKKKVDFSWCNKYYLFCIIFQILAHYLSRPRATALHFCTAFHDFLRLTSRLFSRKLFYIWFRFMQGAISLNKSDMQTYICHLHL